MRITLLCLFGALLGCGSQSPSSIDECLEMSPGSEERTSCMEATIVDAFRADPVRGEQLIEEEVGDQRLRDFMWYIVTKEVNPGSPQYCEKIETVQLAERCRAIVQRPHLHRELLDDENGAAGGGPPAGGGAPPPPQ